MKTLLKILIVLAGLGFVGNLLNEKVNIPLIVFIIILGVALILLEHYRPLDMKRTHKEAILLVVLLMISSDQDKKGTTSLMERMMKIINYKNSVGYMVSDTCDMLLEDSKYLRKKFSEFDDHQREYFTDKLEELMQSSLFPNDLTKDRINEFLASIPETKTN